MDKNTSGLLVVARNEVARQKLIQQFKHHQIERQYVAVVYGRMISGKTIDLPIGRDKHHRIKQAVREDGKPSVTHIRVIERFNHHSYLKLTLATGRTHQIRVHLSHHGYPIVGDILYGGKLRLPKAASEPLKQALKNFTCQALHADKLSLTHPQTGEKMSWQASPPPTVQKLLKTLKIHDCAKLSR